MSVNNMCPFISTKSTPLMGMYNPIEITSYNFHFVDMFNYWNPIMYNPRTQWNIVHKWPSGGDWNMAGL